MRSIFRVKYDMNKEEPLVIIIHFKGALPWLNLFAVSLIREDVSLARIFYYS